MWRCDSTGRLENSRIVECSDFLGNLFPFYLLYSLTLTMPALVDRVLCSVSRDVIARKHVPPGGRTDILLPIYGIISPKTVLKT